MGDGAVSVSKGIFTFNTDEIFQHRRQKSTSSTVAHSNFSNKLWYKSYIDTWSTFENKIESLNSEMFSNLLSNMVLSIKQSYSGTVTEIPTAALLTGINMPDHSTQFLALAGTIRKSVTPHIAILQAEDCVSLKYLIENTVYQIVNDAFENDGNKKDFIYTETKKKITKVHCTLAYLQAWYDNLCSSTEKKEISSRQLRGKTDGKRIIVVIIPDFENLNDKVIQDFILVLSSHIQTLPFVLVFGVATSASALHKSLPYHVSSKLSIQIFNTQQSIIHLTNIVDNAFYTSDYPFRVGGTLFNFFTDIFLYYDLSVKGFIKDYKFAALEHFSKGNIIALCTKPKHFSRILELFTHDDFESIRQLPSFIDYLAKEKPIDRSDLLKKDDHLKKFLKDKLNDLYVYLKMFHLHLKCLHVLVSDLPQAPLGQQIRELYCHATTQDITKSPDYRKCFQLLSFQSKEELSKKFKKLCEIFEEELQNNKNSSKLVEDQLEELENHLEELENVTTEVEDEMVAVNSPSNNLMSGNRKQFREKLLELSKASKPLNKYEALRAKLIPYLEKMLEDKIRQPSLKIFYEIFFNDDMCIKRRVIGSHRAAIHTALSNPHHYLQCDCCELPNESKILPSMPDISILYKLHLEYGKIINLYDWLQSFLSILELTDGGEEKIVVKPEVQARFTQGVADLEFLGFIKSSKRKPDYVTRLTWGG